MVSREVDYVKIGARIKKLRTEKGLTQAELASCPTMESTPL